MKNEHVQERVRKTRQIIGHIWELGEGRFEERLILLFNCLVQCIALYGTKAWKYSERSEIVNLQIPY